MLANLSQENIETLTRKLTFQLAPSVPRDNCRARDNSSRHLQETSMKMLRPSSILHT